MSLCFPPLAWGVGSLVLLRVRVTLASPRRVQTWSHCHGKAAAPLGGLPLQHSVLPVSLFQPEGAPRAYTYSAFFCPNGESLHPPC